MYSENRELKNNVKGIVEFCESLGRGDMLLLTDIERLTETERYQGRWNSIVSKTRKAILRNRGIALRPITNLGYRLCEHDEQLQWCSRNRQRRAVRQLNRGVREIDSLPVEQLSLHQQSLRATMLTQMISERRQVKRGLRYQQSEIRKTETMPLASA